MSNTGIIKAEIKELHECIQVICYNIGRISMGAREFDLYDQEAKKDAHIVRIAELEKQLAEVNHGV